MADRLRRLVGDDVAVVDPVRELAQVAGRAVAEQPLQDRLGRAAEVADRADRQPPEHLAGLLPDAPQAPHRQRLEEGDVTPSAGTTQQPVGLAPVGRELGHELRRRDADRAGHADLALDVGADLRRDRGRRAEQRRGAAHVEERLVERDRLDERRVREQDLAEAVRVRPVGLEVRGQEDDVGAQAPGADAPASRSAPRTRRAS